MTKGRTQKMDNLTEQDKAGRQDKNGEAAAKAAAAPTAEAGKGGKDPAATAAQAPAVSVEDELKDKLLRLRADFENFRRRTLQEKDGIARQAGENIMLELLPVLDHMELGIEAAVAHQADKAFVEGYRLVSGQLLDVLRKFGLKQVEVGVQFDPRLHEAVSHIPSNEHRDGAIISEVRKGYMLGDKLLRAAQVAVSSGPPAEPPAETCAED